MILLISASWILRLLIYTTTLSLNTFYNHQVLWLIPAILAFGQPGLHRETLPQIKQNNNNKKGGVFLFAFCFFPYWGLNSRPTPWATPPALFCDGFFSR
jgi:hypothetical protein